MANGTRSAFDIEIVLPSGVVVPLMLDMPRDRLGTVIDGAPKSLSEALEASDSDTPASAQLEPEVTDTWLGGVGVDYEAAEGVDCRTDGYAFPGGAATDVTITALNTSNSPIHAIAEYGGDLFVAQFGSGAANTGRILRSVGGTAAFTNSLNLGANEYVLDLCVFSDFDNGTHLAKGTTALYACSNDLSGLNGRLHKWDGSSWTSTAAGTFGTYGRYRLVKYFAVTSDGTGGWRLATLSGPYSYSYTIPNADPMQAASWVEGVHVEAVQRLQHLVASRRRIFMTAPGELFTIDEQGNSHSLTSYSDQTILPGVSGSFDSGDATILYHEGFVYVRLATGLDRIDVDGEVLQETPGQCGPGWGTPVENRWAGFSTCLTSDQGWVVAAVWSPNTNTAGIFWGKDARHFPSDVQSRTLNPLIWHGPIVHTQGNYRVMRMHVSGLGTQLKLWISALSSLGVPALSYVSLPSGGNPLQDLMSAGPHRYADGAGVGIWQPYCLPGESVVVAPNVQGATSRQFDGEVVVLRTASDDLFTSTPNHPVLTDRGWIAAGEIQEGDSVVRCFDSESVARILDPDHEYVPTAIKQVANTLGPASGVSSTTVPAAPEYFHGDGAGGDIDIVWPDGFAQSDRQAPLFQHAPEGSVEHADVALKSLPRQRLLTEVIPCSRHATDSGLCSSTILLPPFDALVFETEMTGFASGADGDTMSSQTLPDEGRRDFQLRGDLGRAQTLNGVQPSHLSVARTLQAPQVSRSLIAMLLESLRDPRTITPQAFADMCQRLTCFVSLVEVTNVHRRKFSGHVYNLDTKQGWYVAQNIITHNCSLYGRAKTFSNRWGTSHVYQQTIGSRGLGSPAGTKLIVSTRADPPPGSTAWFGSADVTTSPTQSTAPTLQISGSRVETRVDFLSPSGAATPPKPAVLDVVRTRAWRAVPDMQTWTLPVWYGAGVPDRSGGVADPETDPATITGYLRTAAQSAPVTIRDARGLRYTAKVLQVVPRDVDVTLEGSGQTVRAKLKLADVQGPLV